MKKILTFIFVALFGCSLLSCGGNDPTPQPTVELQI